jgi:acyl-CoA synthetase (AMP-forming)/AMP-acid ligase II
MTHWRSPHPDLDPVSATLHDEVLGAAAQWPERVAVVDAPSGRSLTYGQLAERAGRLAGGLRERGASPGEVLAVVASNGPDFPVVAQGTLLAGLTLAPASPLLTARELTTLLRQTGARYVVADAGARAGAAEAAGATGAELLASLPCGEPLAASAGDPSATALLMSSSGTTGLPKSAMQTHASAVALLRQLAAVALTRAGADDVLAGIVPFAHTFGSASLNHALRVGAKVVTLPRFELDAFLAMIEEHRVTMVFAVPPIARALARHPLVDRFDLSSLRVLMLSAAPCPAELELECEARLGCAVAQALGMTEGAPVTLPSEPVRHGSVGRLAPSTEAVVVDPASGALLGAGQAGELWIRGPQLMRGYLGDEVATRATIDADGWLRTGDLVRFDDDGNLFVVDRLKELIKVRGYHVAPAQLEAELIAHPAVADAAVVPRPDEESGEVPVAYVALSAKAEPAAIAAWVAERVAPYKRLAEVIVVDEIPRAPTGKLLRRLLIERERERAAPAVEAGAAAVTLSSR